MQQLLCAALFLVPTVLPAQSARATVRGVVRAGDQPVIGANVFVVGTLDGALTDSLGRFGFSTARALRYTIAIRRIGFREQRRVVEDPATGALTLTLDAEQQALAPVTVQAGRYVAADEPGAVLTPLEIVTIPGTAANINRAIQTLPGVQQVDEGTGLYVRGGDFLETRVFLNDGLLLTPAQLQNPAGTFVGTLDPFLLDAVYFTSGGFGARYGDALSAVATLRTQRRPTTNSATFSAGLAATGINAALVGPRGTGARLVFGRSDLSPVLRLNGSPRAFSTPPRGADRSASLYWDYRATGSLSLFATEGINRLGALNETPSVVDTFAVSGRERAAVLRWSDVLGRVSPSMSASWSSIRKREDYGAFQLASPARLAQVSASLDVSLGDAFTLRGGGEGTRQRAEVSGSIPASGDDGRTGARVRLYDTRNATTRVALWTELDWRVAERGRLVLGVRRDDATSARRPTVDPRVSAALRVTPRLSATAAWGVYHQVVDPLLQVLGDGTPLALPSMRARHAIVGLQLGDSAPMLRAELYHKSYDDLAAQTRDYLTAAGGTGRAHGLDLIARPPVVAGVTTRAMYSYVGSRRTDPSTGIMAPASADITHGLTLIATRTFGHAITAGAAFRYASGRPFTPVIDAVRDAGGVIWTPRYGAPGSDRLPAFARLDLSASWFRVVGPHMQLVGYVAVTNLLDRPNVFTRRYTADYTSRYDVRSIFNRSLYFGGVLTLLDN